MDHSRFSMSTTQSSPPKTLGSLTTSLASLTTPNTTPLPPSPSVSLNSTPRSPTRLARLNLNLAHRQTRHAAATATLVAAGWSRPDADYALSIFKDNIRAAEAFLLRRDPAAEEWDELVVAIEEEFAVIDVDDPGRPRERSETHRPTSRWRSTVFGARTLYDFYTVRYLVRAGWSADVVGEGGRGGGGGEGAPGYQRWSSLNRGIWEEGRAL